ncbi:hypothetical protein ACH518_01675 [Methylomonas sp. HW2-6]|uniref:hypothetical protein n=1 Tax=Methylomonas sp. HW2-6 TaxID=3376687 RepID=UPI004042A4A0
MNYFFNKMLVLLFVFSSESYAEWGVPEIPNRQLGDIAAVFVLPNGQPVIYYNPDLCNLAGPFLCGFYRAHEYCHIRLGHTIRQIWPQQKELEADCCAAKTASQQEVTAAYQYFIQGGGATPQHGFGQQRAARLVACRN